MNNKIKMRKNCVLHFSILIELGLGLVNASNAQTHRGTSYIILWWIWKPSPWGWRLSGFNTESLNVDYSGYRVRRVTRSLHAK